MEWLLRIPLTLKKQDVESGKRVCTGKRKTSALNPRFGGSESLRRWAINDHALTPERRLHRGHKYNTKDIKETWERWLGYRYPIYSSACSFGHFCFGHKFWDSVDLFLLLSKCFILSRQALSVTCFPGLFIFIHAISVHVLDFILLSTLI